MSVNIRGSQQLPMPHAKAIRIAEEIAAARKKWGKQANPPYNLHTIMDAIVVLEAQGLLKGTQPTPEGPSPEEVTKLRRQLAACQNREKARIAKANDEQLLINQDDYERLVDSDARLQLLYSAGVENWDGYSITAQVDLEDDAELTTAERTV